MSSDVDNSDSLLLLEVAMRQDWDLDIEHIGR